MKTRLLLPWLPLLAAVLPAHGAITSIAETNNGTNAAAVISPTLFGEDQPSFTDRYHQHNGVLVSTTTGLLVANAGNNNPIADTAVIGLPSYLLGNQYIRIANNARTSANYTLTISVDTPSYVYVLLDNRINSPAGNTSSTSTTPPDVSSGNLNWINTLGFTQMNTGLFPNGQPDFTGVDEIGGFPNTPTAADTGTGAGQNINNFYTVYRAQIGAGSIELGQQNVGGINMYSVVVAPVPEPVTGALFGLGGLGFLLRRRRA